MMKEGGRTVSRASRRRGLTLVELLVVLTILALMATVAITSTDLIMSQGRYDATARTLTNIEEAILSSHQLQESGGSTNMSGFIVDTGRLPVSLAELFVQPPDIVAWNAYAFDSDRDGTMDVRLTSGWNGPYLRLPVGVAAANLKDGYGRDFLVSFPAPGEMIVGSQGADGDSDLPEDGYDQDVGISIVPEDYVADLSFHVYEADNPAAAAGRKVAILFYGKNAAGGANGAIEEQTLEIRNVVADQLVDFTHPSSGVFLAWVGTVAVRAVLWHDSDDDDQIDPQEPVEKKSLIRYVNVVPRLSRPPIDLRLRP